MTRHQLTIKPGAPGGWKYEGVLRFDNGDEARFGADERERVIAKAQNAIQQRQEMEEIREEVLELDEFGEIVRYPDMTRLGV